MAKVNENQDFAIKQHKIWREYGLEAIPNYLNRQNPSREQVHNL